MVEDEYAADRTSVAEILRHSPKMVWLLRTSREVQARNEQAIVFCVFRDLQRTLQRCIASTINMEVDIINLGPSFRTEVGASACSAITRLARSAVIRPASGPPTAPSPNR